MWQPCVLMESVCRFDFYYLNQSRFPDRSLCGIDSIAFLAVDVITVVTAAHAAIIF